MAKLTNISSLESLIIGAKFQDSLDTLCKKCGELKSICTCKKTNLVLKEKDLYFLGINEEKSGGKDITRCGIFYQSKEEMQEILKQAKKHFASGGKLEEKESGISIVLQGRHKEALKDFLKKQNFRFKR